MKLPLGLKEIKKIIPQRGKALLVRRILELEPGKFAKAKVAFSKRSWVFKGHFPKKPIVPAHILFEILAQTGAVIVNALPEFSGKHLLFWAVKSWKFRGMVGPNEEITTEVQIVRLKTKVGIGKGKATVNGKTVCEGEITFAIIDKEE